jgi:uncharacterized protein YuzE
MKAAIVESQEVEPGVILDFDANERVVGVEILQLSTRGQPRCCEPYSSKRIVDYH